MRANHIIKVKIRKAFTFATSCSEVKRAELINVSIVSSGCLYMERASIILFIYKSSNLAKKPFSFSLLISRHVLAFSRRKKTGRGPKCDG